MAHAVFDVDFRMDGLRELSTSSVEAVEVRDGVDVGNYAEQDFVEFNK